MSRIADVGVGRQPVSNDLADNCGVKYIPDDMSNQDYSRRDTYQFHPVIAVMGINDC